jgi:hypothetical protein
VGRPIPIACALLPESTLTAMATGTVIEQRLYLIRQPARIAERQFEIEFPERALRLLRRILMERCDSAATVNGRTC